MIKKLATTKGSDRRQFMQVAAGALLGVNVLSSEEAFAAASDGKAKQIVYLFMAGAMYPKVIVVCAWTGILVMCVLRQS